jgi:hypothetical protein
MGRCHMGDRNGAALDGAPFRPIGMAGCRWGQGAAITARAPITVAGGWPAHVSQ